MGNHIRFTNGQLGFVNSDNKGYITEYFFKKLNSGKISKKPSISIIRFTPLFKCELCGKTSTPKKVQHRGSCWGWGGFGKNDFEHGTYGLLCMTCWNAVERLICHKERQVDELNKLINKLIKLCRDVNNGREAN